MRRPVASLLATLATLGLAAPPDGARSERYAGLTFSGDSCSALATASVTLPANARLASASEPRVGDVVGGTKADEYDRDELARVTGVDLHGRTLTVTLAADPELCLGTAVPGEPLDGPWVAAVDARFSYTVLDTRWARSQARSIALSELPYGFEIGGTRCSRRDAGRFACVISAWVGDASVLARGTITLSRDDEWPHYSFRARRLDEYCRYVLHRSMHRCTKTSHWRL